MVMTTLDSGRGQGCGDMYVAVGDDSDDEVPRNSGVFPHATAHEDPPRRQAEGIDEGERSRRSV